MKKITTRQITPTVQSAICIVILLVAYGCASTSPAIFKATSSGDIHTIKTLRGEGRNINEADSNGATPLMYAIWSKKPDVVKYLIESGADIKAKDSNGFDALIYAVDYKQLEIIDILIDKGADINIKDNYGMTVLVRSIWLAKDENIAKLFIRKGANVTMRDSEGYTALDHAFNYGLMGIAVELINAGANLFIPAERKSRLIFIGEEFFFKDGAWIEIGNLNRYVKKGAELAFIDVDPGDHIITVPVSWYQTKIQADIKVKADQVYYFKITQNMDNRAAGMVGGILLETIVDKTSGRGPFIITPMEESVAKEKIRTLLKTIY